MPHCDRFPRMDQTGRTLDDEGVPGRKKTELFIAVAYRPSEDTEEAIYKLGEFPVMCFTPESKKTDSQKAKSELE